MSTTMEEEFMRHEEQEEFPPVSFIHQAEETHSLIRTVRSVMLRQDEGIALDTSYINPRFYNSFNYPVLAREGAKAHFTVGVSSVHPGDGKTLVASNLAVSIALAEERETLLVDFNLRSPKLHSVFGVAIGPGLNDALADTSLYIARTSVHHLSVLTAGNSAFLPLGLITSRDAWLEKDKKHNGRKNGKNNGAAKFSMMSLMASLRDVLYSLQPCFEIIIIDLPCLSDPLLPLPLTRQMLGLLLVVNASRTTKDEVVRVSQRVGKDRFLGFVLNRLPDQA